MGLHGRTIVKDFSMVATLPPSNSLYNTLFLDKMCWKKPFSIVQIVLLLCASDLFFLCRYGEDIDAGTETNSNLYHELYYHFIGTEQSQDILCWRDSENPKYMFGAEVTDDGKVTQAVLILGSLTFD